MTAFVFERIIKSDKNAYKEDKMNENVQREENMNQITKETFEFLWFSYFGITVETAKGMDSDELIKICAKRAYLDMCRTLEFTNVKNKKDEENNSKKENITEKEIKEREAFRDTVCKIIAGDISCHVLKSDVDSFDETHKKVCKFIMKKANNYKGGDGKKLLKEEFTYGQAQKWLNMTIKYMYLMGFWKKEFENIEKVLHVPVDSYIIQAVWNKECIELPLIKEKLRQDGTRGAYSDEKVKSWSKWDDTMYDNFQTSLKNYLKIMPQYKTPLEWEAEAWIKVAKK